MDSKHRMLQMNKVFQTLTVLLSLTIPFVAHSKATTPTAPTVSAGEKAAVKTALDKIAKQADRKFPITSIVPSPVPGLLQVTSDFNVFYITTDGEFVMVGDMLDTNKDKSNWSVTEQVLRKLRVQALSTVNPKDMIIFPATAQKIGTVTVFTDIDCPYCHRLQENIKQYTDAGIEVRYLAFPRSGPKTKSFDEAIKVWCAKDKAKAYNDAIELKVYPKDSCWKNPVKMEYELGQKMGISGTPTMILDNGVSFGGMVDPQQLAKFIREEVNG